jgi:hypothetical protein
MTSTEICAKYETSLTAFAEMCGVDTRSAQYFVEQVYRGMQQGLTLEAAVEHGQAVVTELTNQFLAGIQRRPEAARDFVASCHGDLVAVARRVA